LNVYETLAIMVDILHVIIIIYWVGGFFVSSQQYPAFRRFHAIFGVVIVSIQVIFSMRCPLVLLSGHLRNMAEPGSATGWLYEPFIVTIMQKHFGFGPPDIVITMLIFLGTGIMVMYLLNLPKKQKVRY